MLKWWLRYNAKGHIIRIKKTIRRASKRPKIYIKKKLAKKRVRRRLAIFGLVLLSIMSTAGAVQALRWNAQTAQELHFQQQTLHNAASTKKQLEQEREQLQERLKQKDAEIEQIKLTKATERARVTTAVAYVSNRCGENYYAESIFSQESGCALNRVNSQGCYGLGQDCNNVLAQACPAWRTDYACQWSFWNAYAMRYGSWKAAYDFKYCLGSCYSTRIHKTVIKSEIYW